MSVVRLTILGQPYSKANRRRNFINRRTGKPVSIKSAEALNYVSALMAQVPIRRPLLQGDLIFTATIFYASYKPDLDEALILDALQKRIYENDRQIKEKHVYHAIDRVRPRAEIIIEPKDKAVGVRGSSPKERGGGGCVFA